MGAQKLNLLESLLISLIFAEIIAMNHDIKKNGLLVFAFILGGSGLLACGRMGPEFMSEAQKPLPVVRLGEDSVPGATANRVPHSYIVMFRETNSNESLFFSSFASEYAHHYATLSDAYLADPRISSMDVLSAVDLSWIKKTEWAPSFSAPEALLELASGFAEGFSENPPAGVMAKVDFESDESAAEMLGEWERDGRIWYAEPNEMSDPYEGELAKFATTYAALQDWHKVIKLPEAFATLADPKNFIEADVVSSAPIIAVLDSGVDYEHPQLIDSIWTNPAVGSGGCGNDLHGCNTTIIAKGALGNGDVWPINASGPGTSCGEKPDDVCNHGTHVAGLIAAKPDSSSQVGGVCPMCKIMVLKVVDGSTGQINDESQIRAFKYLTKFRRNGTSAVRIANASLGKYSRSRSVAILVDVLKHVGSGTLVIGAASNEDSMIRAYPAALASAIAVSAVGRTNDQDYIGKAPFSNFGSWVDIAAPGVGIVSTLSGGTSGPKSGTSMATPIVSGSAGLLLAAAPNLSFAELRSRILNTANAALLYGADTEGGKVNVTFYYPKISNETARRPLLGSGLLDVNAMILNSNKVSTGQPLDRVTAGCGAIGASGRIDRLEPSNSRWAVVCALLLPLLLCRLRRRGA